MAMKYDLIIVVGGPVGRSVGLTAARIAAENGPI